VLGRLIGERGVPLHLRSDNGPEFLAHAVRHWLSVRGIGTLFIDQSISGSFITLHADVQATLPRPS
jgi:hypothetical protein